jgi:DNA/RNA endonuclease YhcR with UshA esterase domain
MAVRAFKYGSLVLAVVGVAVLLLVARQSQVPVVQIGSLSGTMNWAYVRVEGIVTRQPTYDPDDGTLRLWVGDGSGEMMVMAYRSEAEWLVNEGLVPTMGDGVALEGTLRIKEEFQYLVLNVPQHTELQPAEPVEVAIDQVSADRLYQRVVVRGVIRDDRSPYEGLRILTLRDAGGEIEVTLPTDAAALTGAWPDLRVGQSVEVTGTVDSYRGTPQISAGRGSDLDVLDEALAIAVERRIGDLSAAAASEMVVVEGVVAKVNPFSAGVKLTLDDDDGTVTLLLWQDLYELLDDSGTLVEGMRVRAQGELAEYRGELEIVPELPSDVTVLGAAERVVHERQLGALSPGDQGQVVRVEGVLKSLRTFSAGAKGTLDDDTGTITLLLWQEVYDGLPDPSALVPGAVIRVEGDVDEYRGELEIVPRAPADVSVVGLVELPLEEVAIGQLSTDDLGQTVQIDGQIAEVIPFSAGIKYTLDDGTGTITLLLWQEIREGLEDPAALTMTARLSARGGVAEYQGDLELIPQFPSDIKVTTAAELATFTPTLALQPTSQPTPQPTSRPTSQPTTKPTSQPAPSPVPQSIASITAGDAGRMSLVEGHIAGIDYFSSGVKYSLEDGTGRIILLVWQNVMEEIASRHDLFPGSQVRVEGEIEEYQGELEIVPRRGSDVVVLVRGGSLPIEERTVGAVTPADEGRTFVVQGKVTRTESKGWLRVWIDDGTGELLIFVPEREVGYLPMGIGPGVQLRITGEVDIYNGQLEIIPLAGADVEVR